MLKKVQRRHADQWVAIGVAIASLAGSQSQWPRHLEAKSGAIRYRTFQGLERSQIQVKSIRRDWECSKNANAPKQFPDGLPDASLLLTCTDTDLEQKGLDEDQADWQL